MKKALVAKAKEVVANKGSYPKIVVIYATEIVKSYQHQRECVRGLWDNREIYHLWIKSAKEYPHKTRASRSAHAGNVVRIAFGVEKINIFHAFKSGRKTARQIVSSFSLAFESMIELCKTKEIRTVLRYIECVNSETRDDSVSSVGFVRYISSTNVSEILAWRLDNYPSSL